MSLRAQHRSAVKDIMALRKVILKEQRRNRALLTSIENGQEAIRNDVQVIQSEASHNQDAINELAAKMISHINLVVAKVDSHIRFVNKLEHREKGRQNLLLQSSARPLSTLNWHSDCVGKP